MGPAKGWRKPKLVVDKELVIDGKTRSESNLIRKSNSGSSLEKSSTRSIANKEEGTVSKKVSVDYLKNLAIELLNSVQLREKLRTNLELVEMMQSVTSKDPDQSGEGMAPQLRSEDLVEEQKGVEGEMEVEGMVNPNPSSVMMNANDDNQAENNKGGELGGSKEAEVENKPWNKMFLSKPNQKLKYIPPVTVNGEVVVKVTRQMEEEGAMYWQDCLVGQFLGRAPTYQAIKYMVDTHWVGRFGNVKIITAGKGVYLFKCKNQEIGKVIMDQMWYVQGRPLFLRCWEADLDLNAIEMDKVPVWIKLSQVPLVLWDNEGLSAIARRVGKPLVMDEVTGMRDRLGFAKVCVMVDAKEELPKEITILNEDGGSQKVIVESEWRPVVCSYCKKVGHLRKDCRSVKQVWRVKKPKPEDEQKKDVEKVKTNVVENEVGWSTPKKAQSSNKTKEEVIQRSNKFDALAIDKDDWNEGEGESSGCGMEKDIELLLDQSQQRDKEPPDLNHNH